MRQEILNPKDTSGEVVSLSLFWGLESELGEVSVQYDLDTGEERKIPTPDFANWNSLIWIPFRDPDFIYKVNCLQYEKDNPTFVDASPLPLVHIIPKNGELSRVTRRGFLEFFTYYECSACGTSFKWTREDDDIVPVCPKCGMTNTWTCDIHGEVSPIHLENGENRCPHCEKIGSPRGCNKIRNLIHREGVNRKIHYVAIIKDKVEVEIEEDKIVIKSL